MVGIQDNGTNPKSRKEEERKTPVENSPQHVLFRPDHRSRLNLGEPAGTNDCSFLANTLFTLAMGHRGHIL